MGNRQSQSLTGWQKLAKQPSKLNHESWKRPILTNTGRCLIISSKGIYEYNMHKNKWILYFKYHISNKFNTFRILPYLDEINNILYLITTKYEYPSIIVYTCFM